MKSNDVGGVGFAHVWVLPSDGRESGGERGRLLLQMFTSFASRSPCELLRSITVRCNFSNRELKPAITPLNGFSPLSKAVALTNAVT